MARRGAQAFLVRVNDQLEIELGGTSIAKGDHFLELPGVWRTGNGGLDGQNVLAAC